MTRKNAFKRVENDINYISDRENQGESLSGRIRTGKDNSCQIRNTCQGKGMDILPAFPKVDITPSRTIHESIAGRT